MRCGAAVETFPDDEVLLSGGKRLRVSSDALSLRELLNVVESGVAHWRKRLESADGVAREQAAAAIKELSQILDSLAQQLAQGRETVRITGRLPTQRSYPRACAICGRGNRAEAKYCVTCGSPLRPGAKPADRPLAELRLAIAARSDVGVSRTVNEDTGYGGEFSTADGTFGTLLLVADGMGGHESGEVASQLATATLKQELTAALAAGIPADDGAWHDLLRAAITTANQRVYGQSRPANGQRGMGTTMTAAVVTGRRVHIGHVGDSRAYLINPAGVAGEGLTCLQLTTDHTLVARLVDIGQLTPEQARTHPQRHMIYRSLGTDPTVEVDALSQALAPGDILLLCSDGLNTHLEDAEIAQIALDEASPARTCERLIDLANQRGGKDNITVIVARATV